MHNISNKRMIVTTLLLCVYAGGSWGSGASSNPYSEDDLRNQVINLNNLSQETIGIEIDALAILLNASRGNLVLRDSLQESGQMKYIDQLQKKGFIKVREVSTMQGVFIEIVVTDKGEVLKSAR